MYLEKELMKKTAYLKGNPIITPELMPHRIDALITEPVHSDLEWLELVKRHWWYSGHTYESGYWEKCFGIDDDFN